MSRIHRIAAGLFLLLLTGLTTPLAWSVEFFLQNLRMWHAPDRTQVVFDLSADMPYRIETLRNPDRFFIDVPNAKLRGTIPDSAVFGAYIRGIRTGQPVPGTLRVVFDLTTAVTPKAELLQPTGVYGHRLVIDLSPQQNVPVNSQPSAPPKPVKPNSEVIVVLDPGHGGEDSGAVGQRKTLEKQVVLAISQRLHEMINATPGLRSVMTRDGDYYLRLRTRTKLARKHNADLFVSIHADAFPKKTVSGSSVYALSQRGASSETARWLAQKENSADLAGGVSLRDKDELLAKVLLDLSMTKTINESVTFGRDVLAELKRVGPVHSNRVEQAGFVVLKSPDIPSILVETAYISNPTEEKLLNSSRHQNKIANAILQGIKRYLARRTRITDIGHGKGCLTVELCLSNSG